MIPWIALAPVLTGAVARAETWILPVGERQGADWTVLLGAGYGGTDAYQGSGMDNTRKIFWKLDPALLGDGGGLMPTGTNLYMISWYQPTIGVPDWQPIESQFGGAAGEVYPVDPNIPWAGMWGTNHQYVGPNLGTAGTWVATGPGPHTPENADYNAGGNGIYMWLNVGATVDESSWLYAKWDYGWPITHAWSALAISQIPEPSILALGALGVLACLAGRRHGRDWRRCIGRIV
jgi:hypothetical protein